VICSELRLDSAWIHSQSKWRKGSIARGLGPRKENVNFAVDQLDTAQPALTRSAVAVGHKSAKPPG